MGFPRRTQNLHGRKRMRRVSPACRTPCVFVSDSAKCWGSFSYEISKMWLWLAVIVLASSGLFAQQPATPPDNKNPDALANPKLGPFDFSVNWRARAEGWETGSRAQPATETTLWGDSLLRIASLGSAASMSPGFWKGRELRPRRTADHGHRPRAPGTTPGWAGPITRPETAT